MLEERKNRNFMDKEEQLKEIIEFIKNSSDKENLPLYFFISGMRAQKEIHHL